MTRVTVIDVAYTAGFFDGEGSVIMNYQRTRRGTLSYGVHTSIMNTERSILEWHMALYGGHIYAHEFKNKPATWRAGWQWHINENGACERFLIAIRPYLRIKGALTDNALRFLELKRKVGHGRRTPPDLAAQMAELYAVHKALGTRGRVEPVEVPEIVPLPQLEMLNVG